MSFSEFKDVIAQGDTVILYIGVSSIYPIEVKPTVVNRLNEEVENIFQTKYGALKVSELIGKKYGSKVSMSRGWANVMYPTPELWTLCLPHRTQILYTADISMIITQLDIVPGSVVCEAGTGSGSLSHALLRAIGPSGHLHTRDFHMERVKAASKEFDAHGFSSRVTVLQRDVCSNGFGVENIADAVFLDLPSPWSAIHHAISSLKEIGGRLCSFSPCIEQVSRTCDVLRASGLTEIITLECLNREFQAKFIQANIVPVGYMDYNFSEEKQHSPEKKRKLGDNNEGCPVGEQDKKDDHSDKDIQENSPENIQREDVKENTIAGENSNDTQKNRIEKKDPGPEQMEKFMAAQTPLKTAGHTGFLTFATLPPGMRSTAVNIAMKLGNTESNLNNDV